MVSYEDNQPSRGHINDFQGSRVPKIKGFRDFNYIEIGNHLSYREYTVTLGRSQVYTDEWLHHYTLLMDVLVVTHDSFPALAFELFSSMARVLHLYSNGCRFKYLHQHPDCIPGTRSVYVQKKQWNSRMSQRSQPHPSHDKLYITMEYSV